MSDAKVEALENGQTAEPVAAVAEEKPKLKACCACPETKKPRDAW